MAIFQTKSKVFQKQLADAAKWMMRRNVGHDHFWTWAVLTSSNPDREASRPILENQTAQNVFQQLETKKLIAPIPDADPPAYLMVYDSAGWENVIADGRPLLGWWFKVRRTWWLLILTFILGVAVGAIKSEAIDLVRTVIHGKQSHEAP